MPSIKKRVTGFIRQWSTPGGGAGGGQGGGGGGGEGGGARGCRAQNGGGHPNGAVGAGADSLGTGTGFIRKYLTNG